MPVVACTRVRADAKRLVKIYEARQDAEHRMAEEEVARAGLGEVEYEAWLTWVERAEGPPPSLRTKEREAIARKRVLAAGDLASTPNGMRAVEPRLAKFQSQVREMAEALYQDAVEEMVAEAAACARRPGSWRAGRSIGASAGGLLDAVHQVAARDVSGQ